MYGLGVSEDFPTSSAIVSFPCFATCEAREGLGEGEKGCQQAGRRAGVRTPVLLEYFVKEKTISPSSSDNQTTHFEPLSFHQSRVSRVQSTLLEDERSH